MKRRYTLLTACLLALMLAGCRDNDNKKSAEPAKSSSGESAAQSTDPAVAERTKALEETKAYLDANGDPNARDEMKTTRLDGAAVSDMPEVAELLIERGADVNARDPETGYAPLHWAASQGNTEVAEMLISKGADVKAVDNLGRTPLHAAAACDYSAVAAMLIEKGADVDARDKFGNTPLHLAASSGSDLTAKLLLDKGADPKAANSRGRTPGQYAEISANPRIIELFPPAADDAEK